MEDHSSRINNIPPTISIPTPNITNIQLPESPKLPMEFLSRSWSASAVEVSKALYSMAHHNNNTCSHHHYSNSKKTNNVTSTGTTTTTTASSSSSSSCCIPERVNSGVYECEESGVAVVPSTQFSFASSATSQLVLERIMSQSEVSPLTSGRLSHSSGPLNLADSDSPPISPSEEFEDIVKYFRAHNSLNPLFSGGRASAGTGSVTPGGAKTVGRWLKDRKEKKKEESRAHNAQLHATISVAAVAASVAAIAAATASSSASCGSKNEQLARTDMAVASAATLVAAQCVEAAEAMGAERDHLASIISSAVNVRSHDDITTLTAAAATALRGAATLRARALKDVLNVAAVIPVEKGMGMCVNPNRTYCGEVNNGDNFLGATNLELLARGCELLKRTRKGDLHWKIISVYIHRTGQVMLKMKSRHVAGTFTKKKKNVVLDVCKDMPAWPGRHLLVDGDERRYFALKTATRGIIEFECKNQREHNIWTQGVSRLLSIVAQRKNRI